MVIGVKVLVAVTVIVPVEPILLQTPLHVGAGTVQNAADAAALAGARAVAKWSITNRTSAQTDAAGIALAAGNTMSSSVQMLDSCYYIDYAGSSLAPCSVEVPVAAKGVKVEVKETHSTFFIRVVPGAPDTVTTGATATALVQQLAVTPSDGPFIVCSSAAWAVIDAQANTIANGGDSVPLVVKTGSTYTVNPLYVGYSFVIGDNKLSQGATTKPPYKAGCGTKDAGGADWNGLALDQGAANAGLAAPTMFKYDSGTKEGQIQTTVYGAEGCVAGQAALSCVVFLPLAYNGADTTADDATSSKLFVVGFAPFYVTSDTSGSSKRYLGKLLDDYIVMGPGTNDWCRECGGSVVVRLTQ